MNGRISFNGFSCTSIYEKHHLQLSALRLSETFVLISMMNLLLPRIIRNGSLFIPNSRNHFLTF